MNFVADESVEKPIVDQLRADGHDGTAYRTDAAGHREADLRPALFPGLVVPLGTLWAQ